MERKEMIRVVAVGVLFALSGCVGHDDPVGIAKPPVQDDEEVRELSPPVLPPLPPGAGSGERPRL